MYDCHQPFCGISALLLSRKGWPPLRHRPTSCLQAEIRPFSASAHQALHARSTSTSEWEFRCDFPTSNGTNCEISRYTSQMACTSLVEAERYLSEAVVEQARQRGQSSRADFKNKIPPNANPSFRSKIKATHPSAKHRLSPSPQTDHLREPWSLQGSPQDGHSDRQQ